MCRELSRIATNDAGGGRPGWTRRPNLLPMLERLIMNDRHTNFEFAWPDCGPIGTVAAALAYSINSAVHMGCCQIVSDDDRSASCMPSQRAHWHAWL